MSYFYVFLCSFMFSLLFVRMAAAIKKKNISCFGGIAIYLAFLIAVAVAAFFIEGIYSLKLMGLLFSSALILMLGFVDDMSDLKPSIKIIGELLAIAILIFSGVVTQIVFLPVWANILLTLSWILFITNAFNLLDVMDGLASGLIIIISATLLLIALINQDIFSAIILIVLIGSHLGFLKYNYPPAKIYMGDAGSLFSGFLLGFLAINISYAPLERPVALITPLLALSLPIYDTLFLIIMRIKKQKHIFNKTNDHFALRLTTMGYSVQKSMWIMYAFSVFVAISSLIVAFSSNAAGIMMLAVVVLVFILAGKKVGVIGVE